MADFPAPQSAVGGSAVPVTAGVLAYALFAVSAIVALASTGLPLIAPLTGLVESTDTFAAGAAAAVVKVHT